MMHYDFLIKLIPNNYNILDNLKKQFDNPTQPQNRG